MDCETIHGVLAWAELPEGYKDPAKYRWRLNPEGYGCLRGVYLTAISPVLTVTEWDIAVDKCNYKNVFSIDEYLWLADRWDFNPGLFVKEELSDLDKERIEHD